MNNPRRTGLVLLFLSLGCALAGQSYFFHIRDRFWDGVFFYGVAMVCFFVLLALGRGMAKGTAAPTGGHFWRAVRTWPGWQKIASLLRGNLARAEALLLAIVGLIGTVALNERGQHGLAVLCWLLGIGGSIVAWWGLRREPAGRREEIAPPTEEISPPYSAPEATWRRAWRWAAAHGETLSVVGCTLLALLLRLPALDTVPYVISGDEASMGLEAVNVLEGRLTNPFATGWLSHPTLYFFQLAGSVALLGRNAWGLRIYSPFAGAAAVPLLYLLARRLFDRHVALAAAVLLAASHLSIHFSRLGINNIYDPMWGLAAFFFLVRGLQEGRVVDFAWSGFFLGMAQFFYMGGRLLPIMAAVFLLLWWLLHRPAGRNLGLPSVALGGAFLATGAPLFYFFARHPQDFMARLGMVGIIQSGWLLETEPLVTGKTPLQLLGDQFRKSILAFNYTIDPTTWYNAPIPYLDFLSAVLFVLGLVVLLRNLRQPGYLFAHTWFWLCLLFGGVLIENPPSSPRFVIFLPAVCLIAALGLCSLLDVTSRLAGLPRHWSTAVLVTLLLAVLVLNVNFYFFEYTPSQVFGGLNTEVGTRVGEYLREQRAGSTAYFFGPPRMWVGYATIPFLAPGMTLVDVEQPLDAPATLPLGTEDTLFIFLPERAGELNWVAASYPGGKVVEVAGHAGDVLFIVYEVSRQ